MALGIDFGTPSSGDGDTLFAAFTKINNMFTTTTKLSNGDLNINGINIGKANNYGSTAVGDMALNVNTVNGNDNTAVGWSVLSLNTVGGFNTAIGSNAMRFATGVNVINNVALGGGALKNTTGRDNIAIGVGSLQDNSGGISNTSIGVFSMERNISGNYNTALGRASLYLNQSGSYNTAIGHEALSQGTAYSYVSCLGYNAQVTGSSQIQLGSGTTTCYTNGVVQNRSDERDKADIRDTILGLDFINQLRPVDYKWDMREDYKSEMPSLLGLDATEEEKADYKILMDEWLESVKIDNLTHDGTNKRTRYHHGLIAQEVQEVIEASGVDFGGFQDHKVAGGQDVLSIGYSELIAPMIKAIQELTARINVLEGN